MQMPRAGFYVGAEAGGLSSATVGVEGQVEKLREAIQKKKMLRQHFDQQRGEPSYEPVVKQRRSYFSPQATNSPRRVNPLMKVPARIVSPLSLEQIPYMDGPEESPSHTAPLH